MSLNTELIVGGYSSPGNGGGGTYIWIQPLPVGFVQDGGITFKATTPTLKGYFKRLYSGPINVRWFEAMGDGVTDDTAAMHAARASEFTKNGGTLYFPKGRYRGAFKIPHSKMEVNIIGDGLIATAA